MIRLLEHVLEKRDAFDLLALKIGFRLAVFAAFHLIGANGRQGLAGRLLYRQIARQPLP
ncbi:hypothetical protein [Kozakia baliensis]|uniref:hypothetical protein n=1 Tax=Kozakia baliensis TaxID=153496 RepID=UPI001363DCE8|nr:hypothetical protein [Kozakia baliensis]